jgi:hypothetical protein
MELFWAAWYVEAIMFDQLEKGFLQLSYQAGGDWAFAARAALSTSMCLFFGVWSAVCGPPGLRESAIESN